MRSPLPAALLATVSALTAPAAPAGLDPVEARIAEHVESGFDAALELVREAVDVNSGTMNFAGVRRAAELFEPPLAALGFSTRWVDGAPFDRAGHLIAERPGDGPHVLLIGHLDTIFEPDSPFQRFERIDPATARGPGIIDMKGGNVVMLQALEALASVGRLDSLQLTVVLTGDEEKSGRPLDLARDDLVAAGRRADYALGFEDGDGDPATAVVARRGSSRWELRVSGTPAHSSQVFTEAVGAGAIHEASRILDAFRRRLASPADERFRDLTFNPGIVVGGTEAELDTEQARGGAFGKSNVVAGRVLVAGDLRAVSPPQLAAARETMREIVAASLPGTAAEIAFSDGYPPMAASEGNLRLLAMLDGASRDLGLGPVSAVDPRDAGAADVSFVAGHVDGALDGLGLMGTGGHTVNETADLRTLTTQAQRAALLLYRLSGATIGGAR